MLIVEQPEPDNNGFAVLHCVTPLRVLSEPWLHEKRICEGGSESNEKVDLMAENNFKELKTMWAVGAGVWRFASGAVQFGSAVKQTFEAEPDVSEQVDPMAGLAMGGELSRYQYDPDGFYLGKIHSDHGQSFEASLPADDDRHLFIVAGNASGKGVTFGIQNAIRWKGPLLAIDPKGEMAEIAGMRRATREAALKTGTSVRQFVGQKVAILDPMGEVRGAAKKFCVNYDPMGDIDMSNERIARRRIGKLAAGMIIPEDGDNSHFSESAETLVAGTIEAVKILEKPKDHRLPFVRQKIIGNVKLKNETKPTEGEIEKIKTGFEFLYDYLTHDDLPDDSHAAEAASILGEILGSDEAGSFRTTLSRNLKWMIDLDMQDHLQPSGFSLYRAVQEGWSVFLVLNPDDIGDFKNWLRMNVQLSLSAKMALGTNQQGLQTLFFLDEFSVLGRFKEIEEKAGYIRGYGVKLVPIIQNIGQIKNLYAKNWETFLGNAAAIIGWGLNDLETEQYFSDRLGKIVIAETSRSSSSNVSGLAGGKSKNESIGLRERMVRFANEIHGQGARETMRAFVVPASGKPFTIERVPYMALAKHKLFDSPVHIRKWENARQKGAK
ncbi:MAG: type IV secretory system conjugative DNA transfer family protein [Hyphomicrobiales bacterium]|nr:type IV secretory system conjugative DNA transfer family protein [Hyphomicrobiales bacterium]